MNSEAETDVSSIVSTPDANPSLEVGNQSISQSLPESLNERCAEVQSDLGSEKQSFPQTI